MVHCLDLAVAHRTRVLNLGYRQFGGSTDQEVLGIDDPGQGVVASKGDDERQRDAGPHRQCPNLPSDHASYLLWHCDHLVGHQRGVERLVRSWIHRTLFSGRASVVVVQGQIGLGRGKTHQSGSCGDIQYRVSCKTGVPVVNVISRSVGDPQPEVHPDPQIEDVLPVDVLYFPHDYCPILVLLSVGPLIDLEIVGDPGHSCLPE